MIDDLLGEVLSYDRYADYQIQVIDKKGNDHFAKDLISFGKWAEVWKTYPNIKVEGLDDKPYHKKSIDEGFRRVNSNHLFVNNKGGFSFKEHKDDTNVYLHVLKGEKKVHMLGNVYTVKANNGIHIPEGVYHKVDSKPDTWALSIGYFNI